MKKILLLVVLSFMINIVAEDAKKLSADEFLKLSRKPPASESWGIMSGVLSHRRNGESVVTSPIRLAIMFTPVNALSQVILGNEEGYSIAQSYNEAGATILNMHTKDSNLLGGKFGINPEDLTMSFLHWNFNKELEGTSFKTLDCRVLVLDSPDKKEFAKVTMSTKYKTPIKVEWYKAGKQEKYKTLEAKSFETVNELGMIGTIRLYGPGWITLIEFDDIDADLTKKRMPKVLFKATLEEE